MLLCYVYVLFTSIIHVLYMFTSTVHLLYMSMLVIV